jgi:putative transposase
MTDAEWEQYRLVFPELKGIPRCKIFPKWTTRMVLDAIRYIERTGCQWRYLPKDFPPWKTVNTHYSNWTKKGLFDQFQQLMTTKARVEAGRTPEPTAVVIDSQTAQSTESGGPTGLDAGKKKKGRKRHIVTDTLGLLLFILVTAASVQDQDAGAALLHMVSAKFASVKAVFADAGYQKEVMKKAAAETKIELHVSTKDKDQVGFVPQKIRWVVERSHGWMNRSRRLSKDYERTIESSTAWYQIAFGRLTARRICGISTKIRV